MPKAKVKLEQAQRLAEKIKAELTPACERIEIAGSIRRRKPIIGDIEIVCIPQFHKDLFGEATGESLLDGKLQQLINDDRLIRGDKNGQLYKTFCIPACPKLKLDLFITDATRWPVRFTILTGNSNFSRLLVTQLNKGGMLPSRYRIRDNQVWEGADPLPLRSEREFLEICGGWLDPTERQW